MLALFWQGSQKYLCLLKVRAPRSVLSSHGIDELHLVAHPVGLQVLGTQIARPLPDEEAYNIVGILRQVDIFAVNA
jgi:hypothetical protein